MIEQISHALLQSRQLKELTVHVLAHGAKTLPKGWVTQLGLKKDSRPPWVGILFAADAERSGLDCSPETTHTDESMRTAALIVRMFEITTHVISYDADGTKQVRRQLCDEWREWFREVGLEPPDPEQVQPNDGRFALHALLSTL